MFYPPFFPAAVRTFDSQPIGPVDVANRDPPGRDSVRGETVRGEIPLDLSIKPLGRSTEPTAASDEIGMFLDHRNLFHLAAMAAQPGLPGTLIDPAAMYRVPYRVDGASGMVQGLGVPYNHAVLSGLLQQRDARTAIPIGSYVDANAVAALSLQLRANGAAAAAAQRENNAAVAAMAARGFYGAQSAAGALSGYSMFPEFYQAPPTMKPPPPSDPGRRPEDKGAFKSLRPKPGVPTTTAQPGALEATHYAEQLQRLREQHLQAKCAGATYYVPTSSSSMMSHPHPATNGNVICPCCTIRGVSPHPPGLCSIVSHLAYSKENASLANTTSYAKAAGAGNAVATGFAFPARPIPTSTASGGMGIPTFTASIETQTTTGTSVARPDPLPIYVPVTSWNSGLPTISSASRTTSSYNGTKAHAPTTPNVSRKREAKDSPRPARDFPGEKTQYLSNPLPSKDIGNSKLAELASHTNRIFGGQYQSTTHFGHPKNNQKEDREVIVIDDSSETKTERVSPNEIRSGACNRTPSGLLHRPVPQQKARSPLTVPSVSHSSKRNQESDNSELVPAKMPRLEAAVRQNGDVASDALSPTGPPPLLASVVPSGSVVTSSNYLPIFRVAPEIPTSVCQALPKRVLPVVPTPTVPAKLPHQFVGGFRINGVIQRESPRASTPDPVPESGSPKASSSLLKCGLPVGTEPSTAATVGEYEKHFVLRPSVPVALESAGGTNCLGPSDDARIPAPSFGNVPLVVPAVKPVRQKEVVLPKPGNPLMVAGPSSSTRTIENKSENQRAFKIYSDHPKFDIADEQKLKEDKSLKVSFAGESIFQVLKREQSCLREAENPQKSIDQVKPLSVKVKQEDNLGDPPVIKTEKEVRTVVLPNDLPEVKRIEEMVEKREIKEEKPIDVKMEICDEIRGPSPSTSKKASSVEDELRQELLRATDARTKKKLRRRLLERLHRERMDATSPEDELLKEEDVSDEDMEAAELCGKLKLEEDVEESTSDDKGAMSWRQRRLIQLSCSHVRRRRFRSGLDMIARRYPKKKAKGVERRKEEQRHVDESYPKILCDEAGELIVPPEMKRLIVNKALGETILHKAARQCYPDVVLYCLETKSCEVNSRDNAGYTPLHECCSRGHLEVARALLQYGADVNASAAGGIRPLHDAVENDHVEVVRLLLSYGADPTISTYSGLSPLKLARSPIMSEFLRGFMADLTGEAEGGRPPLPWHFMGSTSCLDTRHLGYDVFEGVPADLDREGECDNDFLFEVSDSPHLPTFRLQLPSTGSKAVYNWLRLTDVLKQVKLTKQEFSRQHGAIKIQTLARREFESSASFSQLLTGSKMDAGASTDSDIRPDSEEVDVVKLDNDIRNVLGIETVILR